MSDFAVQCLLLIYFTKHEMYTVTSKNALRNEYKNYINRGNRAYRFSRLYRFRGVLVLKN